MCLRWADVHAGVSAFQCHNSWCRLGSIPIPLLLLVVLINHITCNPPVQPSTLITPVSTWIQYLQPRSWRQYIPLKCRYQPTTLHGAKSRRLQLECVDMIIICLCKKFHECNSNNLLVITIKLTAKCKFHAAVSSFTFHKKLPYESCIAFQYVLL